MSNESFYLTALKILLPVYSPDATVIRDPGLVKELAAYRSTNYTASRHTPNRNIVVRIYEAQRTGELFKVKEAL